MRISWKIYAWVLVQVCLLTRLATAGGSGFNVAVVVNQSSSNSVQLGNYYAEKRGVPPQNIIRITWNGLRTEWFYSDCSNALLGPVRSALFSRQLTNQVDYLVLSMDIPYRVVKSTSANSTTSVLFYGFKDDDPAPGPGVPASCSLPAASTSAYAASELPFRAIAPGSLAPTNLLTTMITASNLALAKLTVDQGVGSDGSFPIQTVYLAKGPDYNRNVRYPNFDNAVFENRVRGSLAIERTEAGGPGGFGNILGFQSGMYNYGVSQVWFMPGAIADNLTSFGGLLFEENGVQLNLLALTAAGASGSYGTVVEPCAYLEKFPSPMAFFYQARGFSLAESYYLSLTNPYQGVMVGEPLAAPFAKVGQGTWLQPSIPGTVLSGIASLSARFNAIDNTRPLQMADLFLDGHWVQTITNVAPARNNALTLVLNGTTISQNVAQNATIQSVASSLAGAINQKSALTTVTATAVGDRIQLVHGDPSVPATQIGTLASSSVGSATVLTTWLNSSRTNFLSSTANGIREYSVAGSVVVGDYLTLTITRTNGVTATFGVTNSSSGTTLMQFVQQLMNLVNDPANGLQGADGVKAQDLQDQTQGATPQIAFALRALSAGWPASQIQANLQGSFTISPATNFKLDRNLDDLKHRNHLYVSAGLNPLTAVLAFNTTGQSDGPHQLSVVAYEGTGVRTQTRAELPVVINNNSWSANLTPLMAGGNTLISATMQFRVTATIAGISRIELYSTGGLVGSAVGTNDATFSVAGTSLGLGNHPFYALVTANSGQSFRTAQMTVRLVETNAPVRLAVSVPPPLVSWAAVAGRSYQMLSATNVLGPYVGRGTVTATNSTAQWSDTNGSSPRFYRVVAP